MEKLYFGHGIETPEKSELWYGDATISIDNGKTCSMTLFGGSFDDIFFNFFKNFVRKHFSVSDIRLYIKSDSEHFYLVTLRWLS